MEMKEVKERKKCDKREEGCVVAKKLLT